MTPSIRKSNLCFGYSRCTLGVSLYILVYNKDSAHTYEFMAVRLSRRNHGYLPMHVGILLAISTKPGIDGGEFCTVVGWNSMP